MSTVFFFIPFILQECAAKDVPQNFVDLDSVTFRLLVEDVEKGNYAFYQPPV